LSQVENGDLNWIVPGKLVAFSGPAARPTDYVGFRAMVPEDYWHYFSKRGVQSVVRLNKKACSESACLLRLRLRTWLLVHVGNCQLLNMMRYSIPLASAAGV
jgi:hypothetical protein